MNPWAGSRRLPKTDRGGVARHTQLARAALHTDDLTAIAGAIGYQGESAFSTAFRRVVGMSPREFRVSLRARPRDDD
ncbi:helix-turn-helix domain-containing protein [Amycolatopsis magusensis]|uniref:helix-turn-helix domain-containing protein n=1 Tax=Amycolatopsis magusensis TaxID=882444 RepID=UPI0037AF832E